MANRVQHYLRTTRWVKAESTIKVTPRCRIRRYDENEAEHLAKVIRNRDVSARLRGQRDFYYKRATNLEDRTVVEVINSGEIIPSEELNRQAELAEATLMSSLILQGDRDSFVRKAVGIPGGYFDLDITATGSDTKVSSTSQTRQVPTGLSVGHKANRRLKKNGFQTLYEVVTSTSKLAERIERALNWLLQSRTDRSASSAIVKTATAMETLVVIGHEPTRRALSERSAYLLSDDPKVRLQISRTVQSFYSMRGSIVHGKAPADSNDLIRTLEFGDRMVVLISLVLAANGNTWSNADDMRRYCDSVRWGETPSCSRPWSRRYLNTALDRSPQI